MIALLLAGTLGLAAAEPEPPPERDLRTVEVLREECRTAYDRRELTLFANGTIRLRQGPPGAERLRLGEIGREEVEALEARIAELDLSETDPAESAVTGDWVERCRLDLAPAGARSRRFEYGRLGTHSLALGRLLGWVAELVEVAARASDAPREIAADYRPRPGDLLERADGELFEVVGPTADGEGVELVGVRLPLTLYLRIAALPSEFVRRVERRRGP